MEIELREEAESPEGPEALRWLVILYGCEYRRIPEGIDRISPRGPNF